MQLRRLNLAIALFLVLPAAAETYNARNYAMGGAGVASSKYDAAPAANGALLTRFDDSDDFALILPAIGAEISDKEDVIDTLDDIPDLYDELAFNIDNGNNTRAVENAADIIKNLNDISGDPVRANAAALIGFAIPSKSLAVALDIRSAAEAGVIAQLDTDDIGILAAAILLEDSSLLDDTRSSAVAVGAAVTEIALTIATEFPMGEENALSVSVTPKYQRVDTLLYAVTVNDFDSNDFDDNTNDDANFNIDIGLAYFLGERWVFGFRARNLISNDYETETVVLGVQRRGFQGKYEVAPTAVAAVAYNLSWFTATLEADLVDIQSFERLEDSQFLRAGVEFDAFKWMQLRAGYRYDIEDTRANIFTAGLGFSPFDVFHLDISGAYGEDDTYGAALDLRWTF